MKKYLLASFAILFLVGFSHVARADITTGLVANWNLDEGSGTTAADSVGGFTGTLVNGATWTTGKIGSYAVAFAGSPVQYISTTYTGQLTDFTVCAWFNPSSNSSYRRIVDKNSQTGFWLGENPSGQWGGGIEQTSSPYGTYVTIPNALGNWHHLCMTRSGTTQTVYADGGAESANGTVSSAALDGTKFYIGAANTASNAFAGSIDDIRIYNRALSAADVSELYSYTGASRTMTGGGSSGAGDSQSACGANAAELAGWGWSSNIGWISFNSGDSNTGDGGAGQSPYAYGVQISTTTGSGSATFCGYAWSPNVGWISFNSADVVGCPGGSPASAAIDSNGNLSGAVTGFIRVISEENRSDGWDGCVYLGDPTRGSPQYSPTADSNTFPGSDGYNYLQGGVTYSILSQFFKGFAWTNSVIGWLSFNNPFSSQAQSVHICYSCNGGGPSTPDFLVTNNSVNLPQTGSTNTSVTINRSGSNTTEQDINEVIHPGDPAVTAVVANNPAVCNLTADTSSCTVSLYIYTNNATSPSYTVPVYGVRSSDGATRIGNITVNVTAPPGSAPVSLYIGASQSDIDSKVSGGQSPTTYTVKKGKPFALEWDINLDPNQYPSCNAYIDKGTWPEWNGQNTGVDLSGYQTGSPNGFVNIPSTDTSNSTNKAATYTFSISCGNSQPGGLPAQAAATLILQSSSESEI